VNVSVSAAGGTSLASTASRFTFAPTITEVNPNAGPAAGGTSVTIKGTGFATGAGATRIQFGSTQASGVNCASSTECTLTTPAHAAGAVSVYATVNKVKSAKSASARFTYS
jgi:hypothetical protein